MLPIIISPHWRRRQMRAQTFPFYVQEKLITPSRFLEDRRTRADMEAEPTEVRISQRMTLSIGFVPVRLKKPRDPQTFVFGEMATAGGLVMTHYTETPMIDADDPSIVAADGKVPFRIVPRENRVQLFVAEGMGAIPEFTVVPREETHLPRRHLLVGDIWRGSIWTHSVMEIPIRRARPVRTRAVRFEY